MSGGYYSKCSCSRPVEWVKGKTVGSGSFGSVHLAMNKATGGLFVVKSAESDSGLQFLESEAEILESLDSPHVVKCIGKEMCGGKKLNLFIEYMAGGSLADVTQQFGGKLDEMVIRLYTREILLGLKYLHENGIVHSDLKCRNVLLSSSGDVKLADFGCSKRVKKHPNPIPLAGVAGSPLWMAPETLRNQGGLDCASDIWSLGCTIIEMATGNLPWAGKISNPVSAVLRIACSEDRPNFPSHFSQEGLDFLEKCLERDPRKRWKAEELLHHPFVNPESEEFAASSPASVLDRSIFPETDYSDESDEEDETPLRSPVPKPTTNRFFPFSILCENKFGVSEQHPRFGEHWSTSEEWITVRTS
ncbi:PREDICTED: mitogen-activated protein kinase kinase kinase NPK1-like [Ipomoea nil]|uniref:mitogen-activated protein kinase kinase kinase NPK1-like n=1 Tax=Ipomoea nil TaxID=35883 RepID=UPI0009008585|nr:PREDICTED: mitogen-activated protein kinase kinase kinase NPK1-like [Ipomoea nil]